MKSRFVRVLDALDAGVVIHAPDTSIVEANARARELLGMQDIGGRLAADPAWVFMDAEQHLLAIDKYPVVAAIRTGRAVREQTILVRRPDGNVIWVQANAVPRFDEANELLDVAVTFIDVTEREAKRQEAEQLSRELMKLAVTDSLTGLANRRGIFEQAERMRAAAAQLRERMVVLMLDLDKFKRVNDLRGHRVGDNVLTEMARAVESQLRRHDVAGRIGGDEILILLPETDTEGGRVLAERIRDSIASAGSPTAGDAVTCSIGLAAADPADSVAEIVHRADEALYRAKQAGGNCVEVA